jgi:integrase
MQESTTPAPETSIQPESTIVGSPDRRTTFQAPQEQQAICPQTHPGVSKFWIVANPSRAVDRASTPQVPKVDHIALKLEEDKQRRLRRIADSLKIAGVTIGESPAPVPTVESDAGEDEEEAEEIDIAPAVRHFNSGVPARRILITGSDTDPDCIAHLPLADSIRKWHEYRRPPVNPRTHQNNWHNAMQLLRFFGDMKPSEIRPPHLRGYQEYRTHNVENRWAKKAAPSIINHELSVLQQILKHAGCWNKFRDHYRALPLPRPKEQKVFTEEEEKEFLKLVQTKQDLQLPCHVALFTINTTCAGSELRHLKWKNVELNNVNAEGKPDPIVTVPAEGAKNEFRARRVSLNPTAVIVMRKIMERARRLGSSQPDHYLFPYSVRGYNYDPTRPTSESWLKKGWEKLREAAKAPWLTPHCLRYMAITALYEAGVPEPTIQAMAGHTSARMSRHYNRSRNAQLSAAAAVLDSSRRGEIKPEWRRFVEGEADPQRSHTARSGARVISFPGRMA